MEQTQVFDTLRNFADEMASMRHSDHVASVAPQLRQIERFLRDAIYTDDILILSNIPLHARRVVQYSDSTDTKNSVHHINDFVTRLLKKHKNPY